MTGAGGAGAGAGSGVPLVGVDDGLGDGGADGEGRSLGGAPPGDVELDGSGVDVGAGVSEGVGGAAGSVAVTPTAGPSGIGAGLESAPSKPTPTAITALTQAMAISQERSRDRFMRQVSPPIMRCR